MRKSGGNTVQAVVRSVISLAAAKTIAYQPGVAGGGLSQMPALP
jgi:hypothetical protein